MAIMKRDVNLGLLLLIVAALLMFSGFTVYYQTTFKNISKNYDTKLKELEVVSKELDSKRGLLNETSVQLQLNNQKEADLSKKFVDTKSEKDQLEVDKKALQTELTSTKLTLAQTQTDLEQKKATINQLSVQIADMSNQILGLKADIDRLFNDKKKAEAQRDCYKAAAPSGTSC